MLQEQSTTDADSDPRHDGQASTPVSPIKAFVLLLGVLAIAGLVLLVTRSDNPLATPSIDDSPSTEASNSDQTDQAKPERLTNSQAKAVFRRLDKRLTLAYRRRSLGLVRDSLTSTSPMLPVIQDEIDRLEDQQVLDKTTFSTRRLTVAHSSDEEVLLTQVVIVNPRFVSEAGRDVTSSKARDRDLIHWVLRNENEEWVLHSARVIDRKRVG